MPVIHRPAGFIRLPGTVRADDTQPRPVAPGVADHDWLVAEILRREARRLIHWQANVACANSGGIPVTLSLFVRLDGRHCFGLSPWSSQ
jgi:hypothetical protein